MRVVLQANGWSQFVLRMMPFDAGMALGWQWRANPGEEVTLSGSQLMLMMLLQQCVRPQHQLRMRHLEDAEERRQQLLTDTVLERAMGGGELTYVMPAVAGMQPE